MMEHPYPVIVHNRSHGWGLRKDRVVNASNVQEKSFVGFHEGVAENRYQDSLSKHRGSCREKQSIGRSDVIRTRSGAAIQGGASNGDGHTRAPGEDHLKGGCIGAGVSFEYVYIS